MKLPWVTRKEMERCQQTWNMVIEAQDSAVMRKDRRVRELRSALATTRNRLEELGESYRDLWWKKEFRGLCVPRPYEEGNIIL